MEAFLLTLNVVVIVLLALGVRKVSQTKNPNDMGWLSYSEKKIVRGKINK